MTAHSGKDAFERSEAKPVALEVIADGIPAELRARPQWVCWRYDWRVDKDGKRKWTKVPIVATTGGFAKSNDPKTWAPFDEVLAYYQAYRSRIDGIGYVFAADDPYAGVDLDDARDSDTGAVREWAKPILVELASYTEVSPSGTGLKTFVRGRLPEDCRHTQQYGDGKVEIYDRGRYFAVTGHRLEGVP